ncbi:MAG: MFS transporter [Sneathiella sp.]|nr:MFS transporter [Sneathiella sp.]
MPRAQQTEFTFVSIGLLLICFSIGTVGRMLLEHFPNLVPAFTEEFGWSRSTIASIFSLCSIITGLTGPIAGLLFDRFGPLIVFSAGFALAGSGLLISGNAEALWEMYIGLGVFVGLSAALCGNVTNSTLVTRWFKQKLPLALSIIFAAYGAGSLIGFSLSQYLITHYGWRNAEIYIGVAILCGLVCLWVLPWRKLAAGRKLPKTEENYKTIKAEPDITLKEAIRMPAFWGLASIFFITGNGTYATLFQSVSYLIDRGFPAIQASSYLGLMGALIPPGMICCGFLLTRFNIIIIAASTHIMTALGIVSLWLINAPSDLVFVIAFIAFFGLTAGTRAPITGSLASRLFSGRNFGVIFGSISIGGGMGVASGSFMSGLIYDMTNSYGAAFTYAGICMLVGGLPPILIPSLRRSGKRQQL